MAEQWTKEKIQQARAVMENSLACLDAASKMSGVPANVVQESREGVEMISRMIDEFERLVLPKRYVAIADPEYPKGSRYLVGQLDPINNLYDRTTTVAWLWDQKLAEDYARYLNEKEAKS